MLYRVHMALSVEAYAIVRTVGHVTSSLVNVIAHLVSTVDSVKTDVLQVVTRT